jgi:hypothetical protein
VIYFRDLFRRLRQSLRWVAAQFVLTILLILIGIAWMRLPEKHVWQVLLSLLLPLLVAISALELQAGTMRSLANNNGYRVKLIWGALSLLFWIGVAWVCWAVLDWCDDQIPQWAGYLNSQTPAHWRAKFLTFEHLSLWMSYVEWVFRWIIVPAKVIPFAITSAQSGWQVPVRRVLQLLCNWRWWLGVMIVALISELLPAHFYSADPHGTVTVQVWHVSLKLTASYLLAITGWVLLLAWAEVLFGCQKPLPESDALTELSDRLRVSRRWVGALFVWMLLYTAVRQSLLGLPDDLSWKPWILVPITLILLAAELVLQVLLARALLKDDSKRVKLIWATLAPLLWMVPPVVAFASLDSLHILALQWLLTWLVVPAVFIPFVAASTVRGVRLPWMKVLRVVVAWQWWLNVMIAAIIAELVVLISNHVFTSPSWVVMGAFNLVLMGIWILLLAWFAVLFNRDQPPANEHTAETPAPAEPPEPEKQASVRHSSPDSD